MSLWLCLRFSQLPLQSLNRSEEVAVAVLEKQRVLRANDCAASLGIRQGMGTATVRALAEEHSIQLLERDTTAEQRSLGQLCCWAYSITPTLYSVREDCLQLEIGGSLALFKGLPALLAEVDSGIASRGYLAHYGLAETPAAAWLLSFAEREAAMNHPQSLPERLAPLPLVLLDDFASEIDSLRRAGLETFGELLALPRQALGRRCGKAFIQYLLQLLGEQEERHPDYQPPPSFSDEYWFGYEVKANQELLPAAQLLLQSLCRFLRNTQLQTGEIEWQLVGVDSKLHRLSVRSSTHHSDWKNWYQLTCIRIDQLKLHTGIEGLTLQCHTLTPGQLESIDLFSPRNQREPMGSLVDRLRNRLGLQAIESVICRDEHLPELAVQVSIDAAPVGSSARPPGAQRPFWLMPQPQRLKGDEQTLYWNGPLELVYGPERIEDYWWQEAASRDYYVAGSNGGQFYWVFRDRLARQWYIHGVFA